MADYQNLDVWKLSHQMTLDVYRASTPFPSHEYGLTAQIRRSAASVAANIAEGAGRDTDQDFARFLVIASASTNETEHHALLARDLGYLDPAEWESLTELIRRVRSMLTNLVKALRKNQ